MGIDTIYIFIFTWNISAITALPYKNTRLGNKYHSSDILIFKLIKKIVRVQTWIKVFAIKVHNFK